MPMAQRNILSGVMLLALAGWYAWMTTGVPARDIMPNTPGPTFFPWIISGLLAVLSVALLIQGLTQLPKVEKPHLQGEIPTSKIVALFVFFGYLLCLPYLGFLIASIPFVAIYVWLFGCRKAWQIAACSVGLTVVTYVLFRYGFQVVLPRGLLSF